MISLFDPLADAYDLYRPGYPRALYAFLQGRCALKRSAAVADVGCGTGLSTLPLAQLSDRLTGIEASSSMLFHARRRGQESRLSINWIQARAESTGLFSASQDLVTVAQAFHWFPPEALAEQIRVLKPAGALAIYWNLPGTEPHQREIEALIQAYNPRHVSPYAHFAETADRLRACGAFQRVDVARFPYARPYRIEDYLGYQASRSFVGGAIRGAAWESFCQEARALLLRHFPEGVVRERFLTTLYLGLKAP